MILGKGRGLGRRKRAFVAGGGLMVLLFLFFYLNEYGGQPRFQGKTLGYWLEQLENVDTLPKAELAIRQIGTNAIPYCDRLVAARDSSWRASMVRVLGDYVHLKPTSLRVEKQQQKGYAAFLTLGDLAIPHLLSNADSVDVEEASRAGEILKMMGEPNTNLLRPWIDRTLRNPMHPRRDLAFDLLVKFMPPSREYLPILTNEVVNGGWDSAVQAARAIHMLAPEAREAIPALIKSLERHESDVLYFSTLSLGKMGPEAKDAVPKLTKMKTSIHYSLAIAASEALSRIAPAQVGKSN